MLISFTIFTLLVTPLQTAAQNQSMPKRTIAVLTLESKGGIATNEAATLTDRLRSELVNLGEFTVVERGRMNDILQEQGFNMTGCTSSDCAIEAGRLLGVQQMLTGAVGKIGNILTVDIRIFDVTTGEIVKALQYDHEGDVSGLLGVMRSIANQLVTTEQVEEEKEGGFPWLWISVGVVAVAGAAAVLLGGSGDSGETTAGPTSLPQPDWPPQ
jgi:curli biogenesis system outer membrane secretion channel CsgG